MIDQPIPEHGLADQPQSPVARLRQLLQDNAGEVAEVVEEVAYVLGEQLPSPAGLVSGVADAVEGVSELAGDALGVAGEAAGRMAEALPEIAGAAAEAVPGLLGKVAETLPDLLSD